VRWGGWKNETGTGENKEEKGEAGPGRAVGESKAPLENGEKSKGK